MSKKNFVNGILKDFTTNINLAGFKTSMKLVKTMFDKVTVKKVTFCFDSSGSMYRIFHHFREHLLETLFKMMLLNNGHKFNIVIFNSSVYQLSPTHIDCTEENISYTMTWMNKPYHESKSNLLGGLIKSFDDFPDAVYLVTDGFVNKDRFQLLRRLPHISKGRPIKCIMITHTIPPDSAAINFLEDIVSITNGTLKIISIKNFGAVDIVMPIFYSNYHFGNTGYNFNHETLGDLQEMKEIFKKTYNIPQNLGLGDPLKVLPVIAPFIEKDPVSGSHCPFYHPYFHWYWPQYWEKHGPSPTLLWTKCDTQYQPIRSDYRNTRSFICGKKYLDTFYEAPTSLLSGIMFINRKVLAFNYRDSNKIYLGKVTSQSNANHFFVKFDIYSDFNETQETNIQEIIDYDEQKRHKISENDYVLAPLNLPNGPYEIGLVINENETKSLITNLSPPPLNSTVKIKFVESELVKDIEFSKILYISNSLKEHMEKVKKNLINKISSSPKNDSDNNDNENKIFHNLLSPSNRNNVGKQDSIRINLNNCCNLNSQPCQICCNCYSGQNSYGRVASPVDNCKAKTLKEIDEEIQKQLLKENENERQQNVEYKEIENFDINCDGSSKSDKEEASFSCTDNVNQHQFNSKFSENVENLSNKYTEVDLNWFILNTLNKKKKKECNSSKKKIWKYWGSKSIPNIIESPSVEPYKDHNQWNRTLQKL